MKISTSGLMMKKTILTTLMPALALSAGCDDKFQLSNLAPPSDPPSISEMIATGKEELSYECKKGSVTYDCEFLTGDLQGSGKWHHTKIYLHSASSANMNIDGVSYYQKSIERSTFDGDNNITIQLAEPRGGKATLQIVKSNNGDSINFSAYDAEDKKFAMGGTRVD